jgi:hypothetical protein
LSRSFLCFHLNPKFLLNPKNRLLLMFLPCPQNHSYLLTPKNLMYPMSHLHPQFLKNRLLQKTLNCLMYPMSRPLHSFLKYLHYLHYHLNLKNLPTLM